MHTHLNEKKVFFWSDALVSCTQRKASLSHIHKLVNAQRESIRIDIDWVKSQVHYMHANGQRMSHTMSLLKKEQDSKLHSDAAEIFASWSLILLEDMTCYIENIKEPK